MFVSPTVFIQQKNHCNSQEVESAYRSADSRVSSLDSRMFYYVAQTFSIYGFANHTESHQGINTCRSLCDESLTDSSAPHCDKGSQRARDAVCSPVTQPSSD